MPVAKEFDEGMTVVDFIQFEVRFLRKSPSDVNYPEKALT
jgi:hypothetical protein